MRICNLASGSSGNSTYIETDKTRILVDCGKPFNYIFNTLNELAIDPSTIEGILITHEHSDHISGIAKFCKTYNTPIYAHIAIKDELTKSLKVDQSLINYFDSFFEIGNLAIQPFPLPHDSKFCVGYKIIEGDAIVSICTDLGELSASTYDVIKGSALVYLEANYDLEMIASYPGYPSFLKKRIAGNHGHLSNLDCAKAIEKLVQ